MSAQTALPETSVPRSSGDFWKQKPLNELAAEQRMDPVTDPSALLGLGTDLWDSDKEFEEYLAWLKESRRIGG